MSCGYILPMSTYVLILVLGTHCYLEFTVKNHAHTHFNSATDFLITKNPTLNTGLERFFSVVISYTIADRIAHVVR